MDGGVLSAMQATHVQITTFLVCTIMTFLRRRICPISRSTCPYGVSRIHELGSDLSFVFTLVRLGYHIVIITKLVARLSRSP
jgi:hypothetical protein